MFVHCNIHKKLRFHQSLEISTNRASARAINTKDMVLHISVSK